MDIGEIKIREWCESDGETIPFGTLTYRVFTMVAALDRGLLQFGRSRKHPSSL